MPEANEQNYHYKLVVTDKKTKAETTTFYFEMAKDSKFGFYALRKECEKLDLIDERFKHTAIQSKVL